MDNKKDWTDSVLLAISLGLSVLGLVVNNKRTERQLDRSAKKYLLETKKEGDEDKE